MSHGASKSHGGGVTKKGKGIDFLATGFKVTTNCAFSVKIMENFKISSDHLLSGMCTTAVTHQIPLPPNPDGSSQ